MEKAAQKYRERYTDAEGRLVETGTFQPEEQVVTEEVLAAYRMLRKDFTKIRAKILGTLKQHETNLPHGGPTQDETIILMYVVAQAIVRMTRPQAVSPFIPESGTRQTTPSGDSQLAAVLAEILDRLPPKPDEFGLNHEEDE